MKAEKFIKQSNSILSFLILGSAVVFISLGGMNMNTVMEGSLDYLEKYSSVFANLMEINPDLTMGILFFILLVGLGFLVVVVHEVSHYSTYILMGTPIKCVHYEQRGINPCIYVDVPVKWKIKLVSAAAPMAFIMLPAALLAILFQNPFWKEILVFATVTNWVASSSDAYLIMQYLTVPRTANIREAKDGEIAEWEE
jgi:hypothetical protein